MNINDLKPLTVSPVSLNFGTLTPDSIIPLPILISNPNDRSVIWRADKYGTTWLSLIETTFTGTLQPGGQQEFIMTVNTNSIPEGDYIATLTFIADTDDESASVQIPVYMTISTAPNKFLKSEQSFLGSPFKLNLSLVRNLNSSEVFALVIENQDSQNPVDWNAYTDTGNTGDWLTLDRYSGILQPGEKQTLYVIANTKSLEIGEYPASLFFNIEQTSSPMQAQETPTPMKFQTLLHVGPRPDGDNGPHAPIVIPDILNFDNPQPGQLASFQVTSDRNQNGPVDLDFINNSLRWLNVAIVNPYNSTDPISPLQPSEYRTVIVSVDPTKVKPGRTYKTDLLPAFSFNPGKPGSHSTPIPVHIEMTVPKVR